MFFQKGRDRWSIIPNRPSASTTRGRQIGTEVLTGRRRVSTGNTPGRIQYCESRQNSHIWCTLTWYIASCQSKMSLPQYFLIMILYWSNRKYMSSLPPTDFSSDQYFTWLHISIFVWLVFPHLPRIFLLFFSHYSLSISFCYSFSLGLSGLTWESLQGTVSIFHCRQANRGHR